MAITIVATAGAANANSYLTLSDTQDLIDGLMEDDDVVAWGTATTDQKNRALYSLRSLDIISYFCLSLLFSILFLLYG